jgi:serine-type D-Ala-D-Ala carboxypeptidase (penicillin-binding protein 5/6)
LLAVSLLWWTAASAGASGPAGESSATAAPAIPPAKAELLVDLNTGRVLFGEHEHELLPPASLTKMLTAMIAIDWLRPDTLIPGTTAAANVYPYRVGMEPGQHWPLSIVLQALLIYSANDAAYALAERVGGSLDGFQPIMQKAAAELGMSDGAVFHDPAGLDGTEGVDGGNLMSAWDVAIAARDLLANPTLASIVTKKAFVATGPNGTVYDLSSWNLGFLDTYPGAIGVKTGFTDPAGSCIAAAAERGGRKMLAVVMNGASSDETAELLLNRGFATPVREESAAAVLPAVRQPEPPPPPPRPAAPAFPPKPVASARDAAAAAAAAAAAVPTAVGPAHPSTSLLDKPSDIGIIAAGVALIVGAIAAARTRQRWWRPPLHRRST